jgi:CRISPR-associated endoribonuclease Cas6
VLASFVIALRIEADLALPGHGGEALHGLLFEVLRRHDASFAERLHHEVDKPFSLSGVLTEHPKREGRLHIRADGRIEFRLGLLTDEIIEHALAAFGSLAMSGAPVRFGSASARVEGIAFQPGTHPLVCSTTYPALLRQASQESQVTLQFLSPTSFRAGDVQDILPKPERIFGSLFEAWQAFAAVPFDPALAQVFALIRVSAYELRTELIHFAHYKVIGFKGRVTFTYPREVEAPTRQALNALADFAFFAGVGYKTTMGLGQTLRQPVAARTARHQTERPSPQHP